MRQYVDAAEAAPPAARPAVTKALGVKIARVTETATKAIVTVTEPAIVTKPGSSNRRGGRRPIGDHAMTAVERQRRRRDRLALAKADV